MYICTKSTTSFEVPNRVAVDRRIQQRRVHTQRTNKISQISSQCLNTQKNQNQDQNQKPNPKTKTQTHKILPPRIRQRTRQFTQRNPHTRRNQRKKNQPVNNLHGPPTVNTRDQRRRNTPPGIGEGEADAEQGEPGVVPLEVLGVAHLGEGGGVGVEGVGVGGGGGGGGGVGVVVGGGGGGGGWWVGDGGVEGGFFGECHGGWWLVGEGEWLAG